jgi:hypothetical protein
MILYCGGRDCNRCSVHLRDARTRSAPRAWPVSRGYRRSQRIASDLLQLNRARRAESRSAKCYSNIGSAGRRSGGSCAGIETMTVQDPGEIIASYIRQHHLDLYGPPTTPSEPSYFSNELLEEHLSSHLLGSSLANLPLRTRSKVAKSLVCSALGYQVPITFRKTQPRFPSPNVDVYVQKADNLQVWNQEIDPARRYVVIRLDELDQIQAIRVLSGQELALLDNTGTLTSKYQAKRRSGRTGSYLVSAYDSPAFQAVLAPVQEIPYSARFHLSPVGPPMPGMILSISSIYTRLLDLVGEEFPDPGATQERLRGIILQQRVCEILHLGSYADAGQFPDIQSQALEVKLQLSPTIDLGLISPDSDVLAPELGPRMTYRDSRYAIFYGTRMNKRFAVESLVVTTGTDFFSEFQRFEGNIQNRKLQIRLPEHIFSV